MNDETVAHISNDSNELPQEKERLGSEVVARTKNGHRSRLFQILGLLFLVVLCLVVWHFLGDRNNQAQTKQRAEIVPVELASASQQNVPIEIKSIGNVEALSTIAVRSQVE